MRYPTCSFGDTNRRACRNRCLTPSATVVLSSPGSSLSIPAIDLSGLQGTHVCSRRGPPLSQCCSQLLFRGQRLTFLVPFSEHQQAAIRVLCSRVLNRTDPRAQSSPYYAVHLRDLPIAAS